MLVTLVRLFDRIHPNSNIGYRSKSMGGCRWVRLECRGIFRHSRPWHDIFPLMLHRRTNLSIRSCFITWSTHPRRLLALTHG